MIPSYLLRKRHNIISFHRVREAVVANIVKLYHLPSEENPADIMTKHRSSDTWFRLMKPFLFWPSDDIESYLNEKTVNTEGSETYKVSIDG